VFYPAGFREDLRELLLGHAADVAAAVKEDAAVGCGSGIETMMYLDMEIAP
jgi:hypothetical protein